MEIKIEYLIPTPTTLYLTELVTEAWILDLDFFFFLKQKTKTFDFESWLLNLYELRLDLIDHKS